MKKQTTLDGFRPGICSSEPSSRDGLRGSGQPARPYIFFTSPVSFSIHLRQGKSSSHTVWPVTFQSLCCPSEPLNRPVIPGQRGTDDSRLLGLTNRFNVAAQIHFTFIYKRKKTQSSPFVKLLLQYIWISRRTDSYMKSFFAKWNIGFEGNKIKKTAVIPFVSAG